MALTKKQSTIVDADAERTNGVFTATAVWLLEVQGESSSTNDYLPDKVATLFSELPLEGSPYPGVANCTCRSVKAKRTSSEAKNTFLYTAKYSTANSPASDQPATGTNPLNDLPVIKPTAGMQQIALTKDRDGNAILNAVGDPVIQTADINIVGLKVTANVAALPTWILNYRNTCNDSPITVGGLTIATNAARFILPNDFISEQKQRNDTYFYEFSYELEIDEQNTHYGTPLHAGFRKAVFDATQPSGFRIETIVNDDGSEPSDPVPISLETGELIEDPTPDNVDFMQIKKYPEADYSVLPGVS